jgi:protoheme IX farnesyltransferase
MRDSISRLMTARKAHAEATAGRFSTRARDYFALTKPKVVSLIMFTAIVGMFLAVPGFPPAAALVWGTIGIALAASSAAAINHVLDVRIDAEMARTRLRPLPRGTVSEAYALSFAFVLGAGSMLILALLVNALTAVLTFFSIIGYAVVYTVWLKRATPQNIVIGGAAGAAPPVLGWTAVTGSVEPDALLLFLVIFAWTPPHFWALAIARRPDAARHAWRRLHQAVHLVLHRAALGHHGAAVPDRHVRLVLSRGCARPRRALPAAGLAAPKSDRPDLPMRAFRFSINYLALLFAAFLVDHYLPRGPF